MFPRKGRKRLLSLLCAPPRRPSPAPVPICRAIPFPRRGEKDCKGNLPAAGAFEEAPVLRAFLLKNALSHRVR